MTALAIFLATIWAISSFLFWRAQMVQLRRLNWSHWAKRHRLARLVI
jgi:hypothetical protein